jgi:two-component system LytT family response regulator
MRALIVDDEPLARRELARMLAAHPSVHVIGEAGNIDEAQAKIEQLGPDVVFLDIKMPGGSGFDLLERLDTVPEIIFVTAYDQHAVRAFEVNALDYLLKPVEPRRLEMALSRLARAKAERIFVRDGTRCWLVPLGEVRLLEAEGNYVRLFWGNEEPYLARSLVQMEARLDPTHFFRANRKAIVNLDFVESVQGTDSGTLLVTLRGGPEVEVSRRNARGFRAKMPEGSAK